MGDGETATTDPSKKTRTTARKRAVLAYVLNYDALEQDLSNLLVLDDAPRVFLRRDKNARTPHLRRAAVPEVIVADAFMSNPHAEFVRKDNGMVVRDLGSRRGTFVHGQPVLGERPLNDGDLIEAGHSLFCYREMTDAQLELVVDPAEPCWIGPKNNPTKTRCPTMVSLTQVLNRVAASNVNVLLLGETGTGKESLARFVHDNSRRDSRPYRALSAAAVPEALFESTMFGHMKGSFSGATEDRIGEVVLAHNGSFFLDELGTLPFPLQAKLLRVMQEGILTPLGASKETRVDVRWIGATNANLEDPNVFRSDLYQRFAECLVKVPPLRKRWEDLGTLTAYFLAAYFRSAKKDLAQVTITREAARHLFLRPFLGNLRELKNRLTNAILRANAGVIDVEHVAEGDDVQPAERSFGQQKLLDRESIVAALERTGGIVVRTAEELGLRPEYLYDKLDEMDLRGERDRIRDARRASAATRKKLQRGSRG